MKEYATEGSIIAEDPVTRGKLLPLRWGNGVQVGREIGRVP